MTKTRWTVRERFLVLKHDVEKVIAIRDSAARERAQGHLVVAEGEFERDIRWNHGTMSGGGVGEDGSRADSLVVE